MPYKYNEKYTRKLLTEAAVNSISIAGVLRYLGIPLTGGAHAHRLDNRKENLRFLCPNCYS